MSYLVPNIHVTMSARSELGPATEGACFPPGRRVHAVIHLSFNITVSPTTRSFVSSSQSLLHVPVLGYRPEPELSDDLACTQFTFLPHDAGATLVLVFRPLSAWPLGSSPCCSCRAPLLCWCRVPSTCVAKFAWSYEHALTAMHPHGHFMTDYEAPPRLDVQWWPVVHGGMA